MVSVPVYNKEGEKIEDMTLDEAVFGVEPNNDLVHQVYTVLSGNKRVAISHTKDVSERAGSGRKPWKQKGTGRARTGSVRNPIWRKGGVIFGPTKERNYSGRINAKMKIGALRSILSSKLKDGEIKVVDTLEVSPKKTKAFQQVLDSLELKKSVLVGFAKEEKENQRYGRNIVNARMALANNINVIQALENTSILLSKKAVSELEERCSQ